MITTNDQQIIYTSKFHKFNDKSTSSITFQLVRLNNTSIIDNYQKVSKHKQKLNDNNQLLIKYNPLVIIHSIIIKSFITHRW